MSVNSDIMITNLASLNNSQLATLQTQLFKNKTYRPIHVALFAGKWLGVTGVPASIARSIVTKNMSNNFDMTVTEADIKEFAAYFNKNKINRFLRDSIHKGK